MNTEVGRIFPVEWAGALDSKLRKHLQNPNSIMSPFIKEGMTVLDVGCGPGFFSIEIAKMVGASGKVYSVDLQEGMLKKLSAKIENTYLDEIIITRQCGHDDMPVEDKVDFILAFYVVHEVVYKNKFFSQLHNILNDDGQFWVVEPKLRVKQNLFNQIIQTAEEEKFIVADGPQLPFSYSALLRKK